MQHHEQQRVPRIGVGGHQLTEEQEHIVSLPPDRTRKWMAFAGCAKTSTAIEYANAHRERALYLAFNAGIAAEADGRFPDHVDVFTAHAYARRMMNVQPHSHRLVKKLWPNSLDPVAGMIRPIARMTDLSVRRNILSSVNRWLMSNDAELQMDHLKGFPYALKGSVLSMVRAIANRMVAFEDSGMSFTHDMYLKAFALRGKISDRYSYVFVDEAQDLNPVLIGILKRSELPLVIIGDPFQSIYGFRGAVQAMDHFEAETLPLSKSFRFGPEIAAVANFMLKQSLSPPDSPLVGFERRRSHVQEYQGTFKGRATILSRTNMRLFESLVQNKHPFHVIGGIDEMIAQVEAGVGLWKAEIESKPAPKTVNQLVQRHKTWTDLKESAEMDDDPELVRLVNIVDRYGATLPEILEDLRERHRPSEEEARFVVATAHKAKGLEWNQVVVMDDFLTPFQLRARLSKKRMKPQDYDQEINLLYVTLTRAIETLSISPNLYDEIASGIGLTR
jgi:F-box protein 18 (helicase)